MGRDMDVRKGKLNISVSVTFKIITMAMAIVVKSSLVKVCGNEINGLNALYLSIIGFLSVAELGVGSAITFCMYKPIVEGKHEMVSALYQLFQKLYMLIGAVIFCGGLAVMPFLRFMAKDYAVIDVDMHWTFLLVLISVCATYLFSAKTSLINAYKNNYISTAISQTGVVLQYILQIGVLYFTHSFICYLMCRIIAVAAQWGMTEIVTRKKYGTIVNTRTKLDRETKSAVKRNIKAMFIHKVGYVLVNTVDSVIISAFVGVVSLGEYSNYTMILTSMNSIITLVFTSLTSIIGHLCVEEDRKTAQSYHEAFHMLNYAIGVIFFLGYYAVVDNVVAILFSAELLISRDITFVITLNGFVQFMRRSTLTFRDATGTFYQDRWKPLCEGLVNIVLSVLFVRYFGVAGVIIATILTNLLICHVVEPYVLYVNAFSTSPKMFYFRNYGMIVLFCMGLFVLDMCMQSAPIILVEMLINGFVSVLISIAVCIVIIILNRKQAVQIMRIIQRH